MMLKRGGESIEINDDERQKCEIYTRVVGYYRPISSFNVGKKQEAKDRKYYTEQKATHNTSQGGTE